jgi:16S rRNA (cytidine1402-2'-O)-methyltransferase
MPETALYLIPVTLGDNPPANVLPSLNFEIISGLNEFIVEDVRSARRFLRKAGFTKNFDEVTFHVLDKHTSKIEIPTFINSLKEGKPVGLLSEAGTPCVADPGSEIVKMCQSLKIKIIPLVGPSSIILALMASGFNGQQFIFHGYLPVDKEARNRRIREIENMAHRENYTQIFIETPYRNNQLFEALLATCQDKTMICVASNLTTADEFISTKTVAAWKKTTVDLNKKPTVFLLFH